MVNEEQVYIIPLATVTMGNIVQPGYSIVILKTIERNGATQFRTALAANFPSLNDHLNPFNLQHTFRTAKVCHTFDEAQRQATAEADWYHQVGGLGPLTRYLLDYGQPYPVAQDVADQVLASEAAILFGATHAERVAELKNWIRGIY